MKALVIGSGGREHALVWKLRQEGYEVFCAPGNGGICQDATCYEAKSVDELLQLALKEKIDLTIVGPEAYLAQGVVDVFESHGLKIFGPNRKASQLESSKAYAKLLMDECGIPTARFKLFDDPVQAEKYVERCEFPIVIKADGLAQGKGSYVVMSREEAFNVIDSLMRKKIFGESGEKIVVEEFLRGKEMSMMVLADGKTYVPMMSAMDYKKIYDGDKGPNTGGMGSIAPAPHYSENLWRSVREEILGLGLSLESRQCDSFYEKSLSDQERHYRWEDAYHGCRHEQVPCRTIHSLKTRKPYGYRLHRVLAHNDQRPEQVVPLKDKCENRQCGESGNRQRQNYPRVDVESRSSVYACCVFIIFGYRHEELSEQKDSEGCEHIREDQTRVGISETE